MVIARLLAFSTLLCATALATESPGTIPNEIGLIYPANGTAVAGSYFEIGATIPPYNGVGVRIDVNVIYPDNATQRVAFYSSEFQDNGPPPYTNCGPRNPDGSLPDAGKPIAPLVMPTRLSTIGKYTLSWNQTLYFFPSVDTSTDPPTCSGNATTQSSIVSRPLAIVAAGHGVNGTNSLGVLTATHPFPVVSTSTGTPGAVITLNSDALAAGPTNVVNATFTVAPTGTVYSLANAAGASSTSQASAATARMSGWNGVLVSGGFVMSMIGLGAVAVL